MEKPHKLIPTKSHGYVLVDYSEIKEGDKILNPNNEIQTCIGFDKGKLQEVCWIKVKETTTLQQILNSHKLIATSTEHKIEGLLQYVILRQEDEIDDMEFNAIFAKLPEGLQSEGNPRDTIDKKTVRTKAFKYYSIGFKAAKEKYPFSVEDMRRCYEGVLQNVGTCVKQSDLPTFKEYIQSLKKIIPEIVEVEYECSQCKEWGYINECKENCNGKFLKPKLNSLGQIEIHV